MKYTTIIVNTSYCYQHLRSREELILKEIKNIPGLSAVRTILCFKNIVSDFKIGIWFLNEQVINKKILLPKIELILKDILGDLILSVE